MTEMFGEAWPPMSVPDLAPDDDDDSIFNLRMKVALVPKPFTPINMWNNKRMRIERRRKGSRRLTFLMGGFW